VAHVERGVRSVRAAPAGDARARRIPIPRPCLSSACWLPPHTAQSPEQVGTKHSPPPICNAPRLPYAQGPGLRFGELDAGQARHSPDDGVPRGGRRAAGTAAAPGLAILQPSLPAQALRNPATATAAAGATGCAEMARQTRGPRRAAELAQHERQARAHGAGAGGERGAQVLLPRPDAATERGADRGAVPLEGGGSGARESRAGQ
jgi:hypothetical protein